MAGVEYILNAQGEQLVIDIPKELQGKEVKVVVAENVVQREASTDLTEEVQNENQHEIELYNRKFYEMSLEDRKKVLEKYKGSLVVELTEEELNDEENWSQLPSHKRYELLRTFAGADKFLM